MMRPTTPNFNFAQPAGPSSPPATPTTLKKQTFNFSKNRRQGFIHTFARPLDTHDGTITPTGNGNTFSYNPSYNIFNHLDLELSPRSSSHASTAVSDGGDDEPDSPRPRSPTSSIGLQPTLTASKPRIVTQANFTVEEFGQEDYDAFDSEAESILRPHQYEDADSELARSARGSTRGSTRAVSPTRELDPNILHGISRLDCSDEEDNERKALESEREVWLESEREKRRRRRRSSGVSKRSHAQSIGSDTDDEDILPKIEGINDVGSSARRLRRKFAGERGSMIFDDPPAPIHELEEPESCEELVCVEEDAEGQGVDCNLPYYLQMDVDSDDE